MMPATNEEKKTIKGDINDKTFLGEIRNKLIVGCVYEKEEQRTGYINGVLDFYNGIKTFLEGDKK